MKNWFALLLVVLLLVGFAPPMIKPLPNKRVIPESHQKLADKIRCYYPWKELNKVCVWVGKEEGKWNETTWLWIFFDEKGSSDIACIMTIIEWDNYLSLEFARMDGTCGDELTVEIEGYGIYQNIFQREEAQKGYWGIPVNK